MCQFSHLVADSLFESQMLYVINEKNKSIDFVELFKKCTKNKVPNTQVQDGSFLD